MKISNRKAIILKLIPYSVVYGLVFINYIDIVFIGTYAYHLWLTVMYFTPFIAISLTRPENWKLSIGLGLLSSLMNDLFYGTMKFLIGRSVNLSRYYTLWLIPSAEPLFIMNLGFIQFQVFSWMMALSIYARLFLTSFLFRKWLLE
jgi:hypothetical protein